MALVRTQRSGRRRRCRKALWALSRGRRECQSAGGRGPLRGGLRDGTGGKGTDDGPKPSHGPMRTGALTREEEPMGCVPDVMGQAKGRGR